MNPSEQFDKYRIKRSKNEIDTEEAIAGSGSSSNFDGQLWEIEVLLGKRRILRLGTLMALTLSALLFRTFFLQAVKGKAYQEEALENRIRSIPLEAPRGIIFSKDGIQLSGNSPVFNLFCADKKNLEKERGKEKLAEKISGFLENKNFEKIDPDILKSIAEAVAGFNGEKASLAIFNDVPREFALAVESNPSEFEGLEIIDGISRFYPKKEEFAHILGYVGNVSREDLQKNSNLLPMELIGKQGIEFWYDQVLRGKIGARLVEVDSSGNKKKDLAKKDPAAGSDFVISADYGLQNKAHNVLKDTLDKTESSGACAIALNPKTGELLAITSLPSFDNNIFSGNVKKGEYQKILADKNRPLFNRAVSGEYPPGSTIKPVVAIAALEEKIITDKTIIEDRGVINVVNQYNPGIVYSFYGWNRGGLGPMNVYSAIAKSSDIFFYTAIGGSGRFKGMGIDVLGGYLKRFGIGEKFGIDLPGESKGLVPSSEWKRKVKNEDWYLGDTYHASIGQGDIAATPLGVAMWTAAIANEGIIMKPRLGLYSIGKDGIKNFIKNEVLIELDIQKENINIAKKAMRQAVIEGSASLLASLPVNIAGKTGTAEFGSENSTHAWFTCFAPYENPEIVLTVLFEGGGGGSAVAVPAAKEILEYWIAANF